MTSPLLTRIEKLISPSLHDLGYELVRVLLVGEGSGRPTLQIMAERFDGTMLVEDCEKVSQTVSALLDVNDPIPESYVLEVSSPGLDRPLTRLKDFVRFNNHPVKIELRQMIGNQKRFKGMLRGVTGETIQLESEDGTLLDLPFAEIEKAKISLTDDFIRQVTNRDNRQKKNERREKRREKRAKSN